MSKEPKESLLSMIQLCLASKHIASSGSFSVSRCQQFQLVLRTAQAEAGPQEIARSSNFLNEIPGPSGAVQTLSKSARDRSMSYDVKLSLPAHCTLHLSRWLDEQLSLVVTLASRLKVPRLLECV